MEMETIGRNIKKYRIEKKLRQEDLAGKTNLSANYIGMVERGEKLPSLETFISILNALEISADMVLADVLKQGYIVKNSLLEENMKKLSQEDRERIYLVIETLIKYAQK